MPIAPQTNIRLITCPLTADDENQLTFSSLAAQRNYFEGLPGFNLNGSTYQRKDNAIRYPGNVDSLRKYNYVAYQNSEFTNKIFYAYVREMRYVNENTTDIIIETDVYQTWMFDFEFKPSFVEREHVNDDTIGLHTYPESLEYGNYVPQTYIKTELSNLAYSYMVLQVTDFPSNAGISSVVSKIYNGMCSGCYYIAVEGAYNSDGINKWVKAYADDGKADAILSIFPLPEAMICTIDPNTGVPTGLKVELSNTVFSPSYLIPNSSRSAAVQATIVPRPTNFEGYIPNNNKLFTAPYCYFNFDTYTGSTISFNYEDFNTSTAPITFQMLGNVTTGGEFKIQPLNYRGNADAKANFAVNVGAFPQGSWNNDTYQNWLALNSNALTIQTEAAVAKAAVGGVGSLFSLNLAGAAQSAISVGETIAMANEQRRVASLAPDQARGNTGTQTLNFSEGLIGGAFTTYTIRKEYAEIIDDYFSMYGYKVNKLKVPNFTGRQNWNYVKTVGSNVEGPVPQDDILKMKAILDRGCTFWHNPSNFLNYNANNEIVV